MGWGEKRCAESDGPELLTDLEHELIRLMGAWWTQFQTIVGDDVSRDGDCNEAIAHVHALQRMVLKQAAARAYPDLYRLLGERVGGR